MSNSDFTFDEFDINFFSFERFSLEREFSLDSLISRFLLTLTSSKDEQTFKFLKDLILKINEHADSREYVIVFTRIKKDKKKETRKT
jgi:ferritin